MRNARNRTRISLSKSTVAALAALAIGATPAVAASQSGGVGAQGFDFPTGGISQPPALGPQPGQIVGTISPDGRVAAAPANAPQAVKNAIRTANLITGKPYRYGGGHRRFRDSAYDCSGAVSFALHGAGLVVSPLDSRSFMRWGATGPGTWITVYANRTHAYAVIAGLRFDTSGPGESGPRWRLVGRSGTGFTARHFPGL